MTQLFGNGPNRQAARDAAKPYPKQGTPEWHQLQIAIKTAKMPKAMAGVMGGMSPKEAQDLLREYGYFVVLKEGKEGKDTITKVKGGYEVQSEKSGKNLGGPYPSKTAAKKRLAQVEYFKHKG